MFSTAANSASGKKEAFEIQFDRLSKKSSCARTVGQIIQILRRSSSAIVATRNGCALSMTWEKGTGKSPRRSGAACVGSVQLPQPTAGIPRCFFPLEVVAEKCVNFNEPADGGASCCEPARSTESRPYQCIPAKISLVGRRSAEPFWG